MSRNLRRTLSWNAAMLAAAALISSGCASVGFEPPPPGGPPGPGGGPHGHGGYEYLGIPSGHLPPPGECRIWIPGQPPGQQAPPGKCEDLYHQVPLGAWLLHSPSKEPGHVEVSVYDDARVAVVVLIRLYEAATGRFLHAREP